MPGPDRPEWVSHLKKAYMAGGSSFFLLHGNVDDAVLRVEDEGHVMETLPDYLARSLFGRYDLVLHYDLGRGLRPHPGGDNDRLAAMNALLNRLIDGRWDPPKDPTRVLRLLDHLVTLLLVGAAGTKPVKSAFLFDYGDMICPHDDRYDEHLAVFLNWARSPVIKRVNMIFIVLTRSLAGLNPALVQSPHTAEIRIPMPGIEERAGFVRRLHPKTDADQLARISSGLTLSNLDNFLRLAFYSEAAAKEAPAESLKKTDESPPGTASIVRDETVPAGQVPAPAELPGIDVLTGIKKQLIDSQCPGLLEFLEPKLHLDLVAGHTAAKKRLVQDARLVRRGRFEVVPMGYLICGAVGVGKTFIALCYAGTVGIPCVILKNFRSKYVGETESNLERILGVLRELGPVAVIIDEADAAVGDRGAGGDSGTSSRVFAQLASQMGDTRYRGRLIWFLLTCRPDLLPVDLKRQGRCEEHIPLFYPEGEEEKQEMFLAMGRKLDLDLDEAQLPDLGATGPLSGADIEGVLTRAHRLAVIREKPLDKTILKEALSDFRSPIGPAHEMQRLAAILECSDMNYLPKRYRKKVESPEGLALIAGRFHELKSRLDPF